MYYKNNYKIERNDMIEPYFYDTTVKVGDDAGINKFVLKGISDESGEGTYDFLGAHLKPNMKLGQVN